MKVEQAPSEAELVPLIERLFELAERKIVDLDRTWDPADGAPVFTVAGRYVSRSWTDWTQGFQYGCALLHFDATGQRSMLELGRHRVLTRIREHLTHTGVHDHGFNTISTYGQLRRLAGEGRFEPPEAERQLYELAIRVSGAVQASRWTSILADDGTRSGGFVYSFCGPHSLFSDSIRSMRVLGLAWQLGHVLIGERDERISLLERLAKHALATASYNVYYGEGRDLYDTPEQAGRVAHESIFNVNDGRYRCPSTQQGYSPFSTWTRGLAWVLCGFAELLEFLDRVEAAELEAVGGKAELMRRMRRAAEVTAEWYLRHSFRDGMVFWDSGAPGIRPELDYESASSDPYGGPEPIDSSAAAIAGQGLLRLSHYLTGCGQRQQAERYAAAARIIAATLMQEPYLSARPDHQGLILHSVYHRPQGWDYVPPGHKFPCGESTLWGDYHALELALMLKRQAEGGAYITFFD